MGHDPEPDSVPTEHDDLSKPPSERKSVTTKQGADKLPEIPRAPALPNFSLPPDSRPSYAPEDLIGGKDSELGRIAEPASDARDTIRHISSEPFGFSEAPTRAVERDGGATHRSPPPRIDEGERTLWDAGELELLDGKRSLAIERFERAAGRSVQGLAGDGSLDELPMLATLAAGFFTMAPVFRHFAPFDLSLFSMSRVEVALDLVYGREQRPDAASDVAQALLLLGAYLGECLRQAYGGDWRGSTALSDETGVEALGQSWLPFRVVKDRLERAAELRFSDPGAVHPGAEPFGQRLSIPLSPPTPWDPDPWPAAELIPRLGSALSESVVSAYCLEFAGVPLDRSLASLDALDRYLGLVAPSQAPKAHDAPWLRRASVLVGAYVGEVLCDTAGARWPAHDGLLQGPESYALLLPDQSAAFPVLAVYERLRGKRLQPLREYAAKFTA